MPARARVAHALYRLARGAWLHADPSATVDPHHDVDVDVRRLREWSDREPEYAGTDLAESERRLDDAEAELEEILGESPADDVTEVVSVGRTQDFADDSYPVAADRWLRDNDLDPASHRIVAREMVGNFFEARYGATGTVFMDDRIEVIPPEVVVDQRLLLRGEPGWEEALERYEPAQQILPYERLGSRPIRAPSLPPQPQRSDL